MKLPKFVKYSLLSVFLVDLGIALTNNYTGWFLKLTRSELVTFNNPIKKSPSSTGSGMN